MDIFNKLEDGLSRLFKLITAIALFIQMIIVFAGVICRYVFNNPQPWIDEISTYFLIVITYLGGYVALRSNKLAGITFIRDAFPKPVQKALLIVNDVMIIILMACIAWFGLKICCSVTVLRQKTPTLQIPVIVFYCMVPASGFLMLLSMINKLVRDIRGKQVEITEEGAFTE